MFPGDNLNVAIALEDLAYALYVLEYSSGQFGDALNYSEQAIKMMERLLPKQHIMLSSSQRVKALILEEIAIDERHTTTGWYLIFFSFTLYLS